MVETTKRDVLEPQMDAEQVNREPRMNADERGFEVRNQLTRQILGLAMKVSNTLGAGFLEKPYENALAHELKKAGLRVKQQEPVKILYDGIVVGDYVLDLLVEEKVVLELKACKAIDPTHVAQTMNYLRATRYRIALILNFGNPRLEHKRLVNTL
jgi:GxxExxY protein